jgi:three-Cys-motif partner protein
MSRFGSEGEDIIGKWSEEKLDLLEKYLKAYSVIMNRQKETWLRAYYYIDAFAGSVRPKAKDDEQRYSLSTVRIQIECQVKSSLRAKNNPYSFSGKGVY